MKMDVVKVGDKKPNEVLLDWLSDNQDEHIRAIVLRENDKGKLFWHIYCVS
jgi:hypothetical protein